MSLDMTQFYQVFFDETAEHLNNMESMLLELDVQHPDAEQLNAIFRAAHSIKGSAGTFGFNDLADVTHILENLLDRIRKGELTLRENMIDAFLDAGDILKTLLAAHRGEDAADPSAVEAICTRLRDLTTNQSSAAATAAVAAKVAPAVPASTAAAVPQNGFDIEFVLGESTPNGDQTVENLVEELGAFGRAEIAVRPSAADQPWRLKLAGATGSGAAKTPDADTLREMLEFIARSDSIRIAPLGEAPAAVAQTEEAYGFFSDIEPAAAPADEGYGFFEPLPEAAAPATGQSNANDGEGYGFFTDLPAQPAVPVPEPVIAQQPVAKSEAEPHKEAGEVVVERRATPRAAAGDTTIRVGVEKVDQLINLVGELVITQAMLAQSASDADPVLFERLLTGLGQLERNTRDLQETVMSIRMMPISVVFGRFPRVVRDTSQKLGKQVELKTIGEDTELDKGLIERISDPLTHLIRNSLDHGIESPEQRAAAGKQPVGTITLKAYHQSGNIVIEVGDDGAGLNRAKILAKAKERGLPVSDSMSDTEVWALIFEAGFSTADVITEVSGRGVGMDVVKRNITGMGGRVEIDSMLGVGTRMTVRLPLTLAILDGMSVGVGPETYIIPIGYVIESLQATKNMIKSVSGVERLIQVRGEYLPVIALYEVFNIPQAVHALNQGIMVVLEADGIKVALFVDALIGQHQVVIKSLEANYRKVPGVSGATIMGDGRVAMILDVSALAGMAKNAMPAAA
ncbi:MAG: chemotaxis protein CheW [Betaproteobacteria bacterium]|nr:chemotaxis protein CheW [Betaproteobacteria bacterium]